MKRVIVGLVVVALGLTIGAPVVESSAWDPENPPVWMPVTAVSSRPSADDTPWNETQKSAYFPERKEVIVMDSYWWLNLLGANILFLFQEVLGPDSAVSDQWDLRVISGGQGEYKSPEPAATN